MPIRSGVHFFFFGFDFRRDFDGRRGELGSSQLSA
jgi:hypothetical protein